ncbi:MAG: hypothetical protein AB8G23_19690 [Myxococcota bacterium]
MNELKRKIFGRGLVAGFLILSTACAPGAGNPAAEDAPRRSSSGERRRLAETVEEMAAFEALCAKQAEETDQPTLLAMRISDHLAKDSTIPLGEWGLASVSVDDDGIIGEMVVKQSSSPAFASALQASFLATGPHPAFEGLDRICFGGHPLVVRIEGPREVPCRSQEDVYTYIDEVGLAVYARLYRPDLMNQPGSGYVRFTLELDPEGGFEAVRILSSPDEVVTQKLRKAVEGAAPYSSPPRYESCFEEKPFKLRLEVVDSESS